MKNTADLCFGKSKYKVFQKNRDKFEILSNYFEDRLTLRKIKRLENISFCDNYSGSQFYRTSFFSAKLESLLHMGKRINY